MLEDKLNTNPMCNAQRNSQSLRFKFCGLAGLARPSLVFFKLQVGKNIGGNILEPVARPVE